MINENQEYIDQNHNLVSVLVGLLIGGLVGALSMLLFAPNSGKETRDQIKDKGIELRDRTTGFIEDTISEARSRTIDLASRGRESFKAFKQRGQKLAIDQLDHVAAAAKAGKKAIAKS